MIEKRHPQLQRCRHRHLVSLDEQIIRKPDFQVEVEHPLQGIEAGRPGEIIRAEVVRCMLVGIVSEQPVDLLFGKDGRDSAVGAFQRCLRPLQIPPESPSGKRQAQQRQPRQAAQPLEPEHPAIDRVAREELVRALPRQRHRDGLPGELREEVERHRCRIRDWLVQVPRQPWKRVPEGPRAELRFATTRLIDGRIRAVPHREALNGIIAQVGHQSRHDGRIDAAAQEEAERHLADEMAPDTLFQTIS